MKNTKLTKILLIALSLVLCLSLFACKGGDEETTAAPEGNETTEAIGNQTTEPVGGETTETKAPETTETEAPETTETEAPETTETEAPETTETEAPETTETEAPETTETEAPEQTVEPEVYFGAEDMATWTVAGAPGSKFVAPALSEDGLYVRFARAGESSDGNVKLLEGNTAVTGKYLIYKYRTDHISSIQIWANSVANGHDSGKANFNQSAIADGQWHIAIIDLTKSLGNYVKPAEDGSYTIQWARMDILDSAKSEGYIDIAYIALCDDPTDVASILQDGDKELCPHEVLENAVYSDDGENHYTTCAICEAKISAAHSVSNDRVWNPETQLYTGICVCGKEITSEMLYITEASLAGNNSCCTATQEDGFVRYTFDKAGNGDPYAHIYRYGTTVTGKFMVITYRMVNGGQNPTNRSWFAGSVAGGNNGATGNGDNKVTMSKFIADGEWYTMIVTIPEDNTKFTANADGSYTWAYLRIGVDPAAFDSSCYLDVAEIAFADNLIAAENYALKNSSNPVYVSNLDESNCSLNGEAITKSVRSEQKPIVLDLEGKTLNDPAEGLVIGGWCCTPGGIDSYKIRVTNVNGEAVATPELVDLIDGAVRKDIYNAIGLPLGYSEACAIGAGISKPSIDLSAYAGKKVDFEIVAITNYGAEIIVTQINNLTVAG